MKPCQRFMQALSVVALVVLLAGNSLFAQERDKVQPGTDDRLQNPLPSPTVMTSQPLPVPVKNSSVKSDGPAVQANYTIPALSVVPTLDGIISPGEWTDALTFTNTTGIAFYPSMGIGSKLYLKVDACYLWIGAEIYDPSMLALVSDVSSDVHLWYDREANAQWNGDWDGIYTFPEMPGPFCQGVGGPWNTVNGTTVGHSWPSNPSWSGTSATGYQYSHAPWYLPTSTQLPTSLAQVKRTFSASPRAAWIEAKIDYKNSGLKLTPGLYSNMHFKWYMGGCAPNYNFGYTIMGEVPYTGNTYWFYFYPTLTSYFNGYTPAFVPATGDVFDVVDISVDNSTSYAFANGSGSNIPVYVKGAPNPPPYTTTWSSLMKGPYPLTNPYTASGSLTFNANPETKTVNIPTAGLPRGFYTLEMSVVDPTICGPSVKKETFVVLIHNTDETPCIVWSGDMNHNGTCNLSDRIALQKYIFDANTNPLWLKGPNRLLAGRVLATTTPLDIFTWVAQPALPWATADGCHMDADGNGSVNNLDLAAIKFNNGKTHAIMPKNGPEANLPGEFTLYQNFPNPFNPTTQIGYELPKDSHVSIKVVDVLGRMVKELVNETQSAGFKNVTFEATDVPSGVYYYTLTATAVDGSDSFTKTLKMTASK